MVASLSHWSPNPRATPFLPRRHTTPTRDTKRTLKTIAQGLLVGVLLATILLNLMFILDTSKKLRQRESSVVEAVEDDVGDIGNRRNTLRLQESLPKAITIEVLSSHSKASVMVDGTTILEDGEDHKGRGIHVLVLNQATGSVMAQRVFDTYSPHEDDSMALFINMVSDGRILVFAIKDEGTFQMKAGARQLLSRLGSKKSASLGWRDMWALVAQKGGRARLLGEGYSKSSEFNSWGAPVLLRAEVPLSPMEESECTWPDTEENRRRKEFCSHIEGYGSVCSCDEPAPLTFVPEPVLNNQVGNVPVAIIASNRPHYLYRMLRSLLGAAGANPEMITVFIDGYFEEPLEVAKLFGLRGIQHTPLGSKNARITQHYKASLTATFNIFPKAKYAIIIEEDLDVSPDFFSFFSQTVHLLEEDPSIYCISAWNDQGYEDTSNDPTLLYRVETMPGLGWLMKRDLYKDELEAKWPTPDKSWDWDMWMRLPQVRRNRECVVPDISRTYHFGASGINMNSHFQDIYFKKHSFNTLPNVELRNVDSVKRQNYEELIMGMLKQAEVLDHSKSPCEEDFVPDSPGRDPSTPNVMFIKMENQKDYGTWLEVAKCLKVWDLDARGSHKGMWRMFMKGSPLFVVGVPFSPYSRYKPTGLTPIYLEPKTKKKPQR